MEVRIMSVCRPQWSGVHAFIPASKSFLLLYFLTSLECLLCGRPALAQQPTGDVDTPVTMTGVLHVVHATILLISTRSSYIISKNSRPKNTFICTFCTHPR